VLKSICRIQAVMDRGVNVIDVIDEEDEEDAQENPQGFVDFNQTRNNVGSGKNMTIKDTFLFDNAEIQTTDPSKEFEITHDHKIGSGGFGKVFKVKRRSDGLVCALKFCTPKN